jgi:exonuclease-1
MAAELISCLKTTRPAVKCIVAPYEADAQLAYLCRQDIVDGVVTEDSDAIPYGCKEVWSETDIFHCISAFCMS